MYKYVKNNGWFKYRLFLFMILTFLFLLFPLSCAPTSRIINNDSIIIKLHKALLPLAQPLDSQARALSTLSLLY